MSRRVVIQGPAGDLGYCAASGLLLGLATLTALTGARTPVVWFKICPALLSAAAALLLAASFG